MAMRHRMKALALIYQVAIHPHLFYLKIKGKSMNVYQKKGEVIIALPLKIH